MSFGKSIIAIIRKGGYKIVEIYITNGPHEPTKVYNLWKEKSFISFGLKLQSFYST